MNPGGQRVRLDFGVVCVFRGPSLSADRPTDWTIPKTPLLDGLHFTTRPPYAASLRKISSRSFTILESALSPAVSSAQSIQASAGRFAREQFLALTHDPLQVRGTLWRPHRSRCHPEGGGGQFFLAHHLLHPHPVTLPRLQIHPTPPRYEHRSPRGKNVAEPNAGRALTAHVLSRLAALAHYRLAELEEVAGGTPRGPATIQENSGRDRALRRPPPAFVP